MSGKSARYDVAVVGGGPAGSAVAQRLAQAGGRVVLIERSWLDRPRVGESLAPAVQPLLTELGVWPEFLGLGPLASYGTRSVWGSDEPEVHSHLVTPWACGWHVERLALDRLLLESARAAGADVMLGRAVSRCVPRGGGWALELKTVARSRQVERELKVTAGVVIDATGRSATVAGWLGARRHVTDRLVSVAVRLEALAGSTEGFVMVESSPDGWWYTAPVPGDAMMAMLLTDSDLCGHAHLGRMPEWWHRLQAAPTTFARVRRGIPVAAPRIYSAISHRLRRSEFSRPWLAVGDAALAVDPISGSGVVRALRTAHAAADTVLALGTGSSRLALDAYERDRDIEYTTYLAERAQYYALEGRWPEATFWQRRRQRR